MLCIPFLCNAMQIIVSSTETEREDVSPIKLNRLRPLNALNFDPLIESIFMEEFTIHPEEIFLYTMFQEPVLTLRSIHVQAGKKITRRICLKRVELQKT